MDAVFPDPAAQGAGVETEKYRGPGFPLDDALQLTHVAGPVVVLEDTQRLFLHGFELSPDLLVVLGDEETDELRDVFLALPERRDRDGEDIETVEQVLPELPLGDLLLQSAVGGRDDPHVDFDRAGIAQSLELAFLDDPEQLGLQLQGHLADLVEQYGAAVGQFEATDLPHIGAGERPLFPAEELAFDEVGRQRRAIHRDQRPVPASAPGVNRSEAHTSELQ